MQATRLMRLDGGAVSKAAALILAGRPVAVPTETVYGLAADATNEGAVAAIYEAKGRPAFNPLIVHVRDLAQAELYAEFDEPARLLARAFWPGPLTLVLPLRADAGLAPQVTAGLPTVALRAPAHPAMQALLAACGRPLAAPSANRSGSISPTNPMHVLGSLGGRIPLILDGGATPLGLESTIVRVDESGVALLRPGPLDFEDVRAVAGLAEAAPSEAVQAPGQLPSHYAPSKPLRLGASQAEKDEWLIGFGAVRGHDTLSAGGDLREAARNLFAALHSADAAPAPRIAVAAIPDEGIGRAVNDRLQRAAAPRG